MDTKKLLEAVGVVEEVATAFDNMPENRKEAVTASLSCRQTNLYLLELAKYLQDGLEPYDAILKTLEEETPSSELGVSESKLTVINLLIPRKDSKA